MEMTDDDENEGNIKPFLLEDKIIIRYPEYDEE
jgi:hypothetical protein